MIQIQDALDGWSAHPGPLYARLATEIRAAIERGDIAPGSVLPPERTLARRLAIGRSTVVAAYALLRDEQLLESRQGSGTWVRGGVRQPAADAPRESLRVAALRDSTGLIDLSTAALPAHARLRDLIASLVDSETEAVLDTPGYVPGGLPSLRQAVAARLSAQGLPSGPDQVLITTGDQQALSLLCAHALQPGDSAVVEDPTSPGVLDVLHNLPVSVVGARPVVAGHEELIRTLDRREAGLVYLMPTLGPLGKVLDDAGRAALAGALADRSCLVVDDTNQSGLTFEQEPRPLAAFADAPNLVTVGSMTKLHWGGLRLGWVRGPASLIAALTRAKIRADLGTPVLDQILAVRLLRDEESIRAERLDHLRACLAHATEVLADLLPELTWDPPAGGLNLWLRLPVGTATPYTEVAGRLGVAVVPGALLSPRGVADDHIRLVYARPPEVFDEGVRRLADAWGNYQRSVIATTDFASPPVIV